MLIQVTSLNSPYNLSLAGLSTDQFALQNVYIACTGTVTVNLPAIALIPSQNVNIYVFQKTTGIITVNCNNADILSTGSTAFVMSGANCTGLLKPVDTNLWYAINTSNLQQQINNAQSTANSALSAISNLLTQSSWTNIQAGVVTKIAEISIAPNTVIGGIAIVTGEANDGVNYQAETNVCHFAILNIGGVITSTVVSNFGGIPAEKTSAGITTQVITITDGGDNKAFVNIQATSTLAETTLRAMCQIIKNQQV